MNTQVDIETSKGTIRVELDEAKAPLSSKNFLDYVDAGHYDGTVFHRVIPGFMIQGGGFAAGMQQKPTRAAVANEAANGVKNARYTVAMARTSDPHSATAQFFINVADNARLDNAGGGYAVFGKVVQGMDVVDKIKDVPTGAKGPFDKDCPEDPVVIRQIRRRG